MFDFPIDGPRRGSAARALAAVVLTLGLTAGGAAHAGLVGTSVTATLESPNGVVGLPDPVLLSDTVTVVSPGVEITAGDGTNVGSFMLTNAVSEAIDFGDFTISVRVINGDPGSAGTGYLSGARYVFSDLDILGLDIVGAVITAQSGFSNFDAAWLGFDDATDVVTLALDTMLMSGATTDDRIGDLTITLQTRQACVPGTPGCDGGDVPEPASLMLAALGLAALTTSSRRRRGAHAVHR